MRGWYTLISISKFIRSKIPPNQKIMQENSPTSIETVLLFVNQSLFQPHMEEAFFNNFWDVENRNGWIFSIFISSNTYRNIGISDTTQTLVINLLMVAAGFCKVGFIFINICYTTPIERETGIFIKKLQVNRGRESIEEYHSPSLGS